MDKIGFFEIITKVEDKVLHWTNFKWNFIEFEQMNQVEELAGRIIKLGRNNLFSIVD